jgi:hypothetical protein
MGTFLGHATTGSFFFVFGLFLFLRSLPVSFVRPLRERGFWLVLPVYLQFIGGYGVPRLLCYSLARSRPLSLCLSRSAFAICHMSSNAIDWNSTAALVVSPHTQSDLHDW